jgi:uncharacterized protein YbjT (DUF2867 family)
MARRGVLVTGANGFVGRVLVDRLWEAGHPVFGLTSRVPLDAAYIPTEADDGLPSGAVAKELSALILAAGPSPKTPDSSLDSRHLDQVRRLLAWARHWQVTRVVYISVLGAGPDSPHPLQRIKSQGEEHVRQSPLAWTILRPSLMFGGGSSLFRRLETWALRPFVPVPRSMQLVQPLYVGDLADVAVRVLSSPAAVGKTYDLPGPHPITVREILRHMGTGSVWWQRRALYLPPTWEERIHWPWTDAEWSYLEAEPISRDSRWITELGILPRTLSAFYAPFAHH